MTRNGQQVTGSEGELLERLQSRALGETMLILSGAGDSKLCPDRLGLARRLDHSAASILSQRCYRCRQKRTSPIPPSHPASIFDARAGCTHNVHRFHRTASHLRECPRRTSSDHVAAYTDNTHEKHMSHRQSSLPRAPRRASHPSIDSPSPTLQYARPAG